MPSGSYFAKHACAFSRKACTRKRAHTQTERHKYTHHTCTHANMHAYAYAHDA